MLTVIFYTTDDCHLCEEAAALLKKLSSLRQINIEPIDISASESLIHLYGIRIPVVKNMQSGKELGWPFEMSDLLNLVR